MRVCVPPVGRPCKPIWRVRCPKRMRAALERLFRELDLDAGLLDEIVAWGTATDDEKRATLARSHARLAR